MAIGIYFKIALISFVILGFGVICNSSGIPEKIPWAEEWSQNFSTHANASETWSLGHAYYSWKIQGMRWKFERAAYSPCSVFGTFISECSFLSLNKSLYVYFPTKQICSRYELDHFSTPN
jgi:hypothetical protein